MSEAEDKAVDEKVKALSKAWDKWPIITCCGLIAALCIGALVYNQYKTFELFKLLTELLKELSGSG